MTRIVYIDTSAALKRTLPEPESRRLAHAIADAGAEGSSLVTSALTRVEVSRALRRREAELLVVPDKAFEATLQGVAQAPITGVVVEFARRLDPSSLRSLDAIHLATAIAVGAHELWTYDDRLGDAASAAGIAVRAPA